MQLTGVFGHEQDVCALAIWPSMDDAQGFVPAQQRVDGGIGSSCAERAGGSGMPGPDVCRRRVAAGWGLGGDDAGDLDAALQHRLRRGHRGPPARLPAVTAHRRHARPSLNPNLTRR
jgi:hypothetical protein